MNMKLCVWMYAKFLFKSKHIQRKKIILLWMFKFSLKFILGLVIFKLFYAKIKIPTKNVYYSPHSNSMNVQNDLKLLNLSLILPQK